MLNLSKNEIKKCIENDIKYKKYSDKHIYFQCLKDLENVKLKTIREDNVYGPLKTFLLNWGIMGRVLLNKKYKGWEEKLTNRIQEINGKLEKFRDLKLEDIKYEDISKMKNDIKKCYLEIGRDINGLGTTARSKILHILCPSFFPLWDSSIREKINNETEKRISDSASGYYDFIILTKEFIDKHPEISELSNKYRKSKVKIVDECFYSASR